MKKLLSKVFPNQKRRKSQLLSKLIEKEFKESKPVFWRRVKKYFFNLYLPNANSIIFIVALIAFILAITYSGKILTWIGLEEWVVIPTVSYSHETNYFQNLIAIHAGIGTVIFAMLILIAENLRDSKYKDNAQVLLKVSYLFPITVAEIFSFFLFLFGNVSWLNIAVIIVVAFATVISLQRMLKVLMDKSLFKCKRLELIRGYIEGSIRDEMEERVGNNILFTELESSDSELKYWIPPVDGKDNYVINSTTLGVVTDVNLGLIKEVVDLIETETNKKKSNDSSVPNREVNNIRFYKRYHQQVLRNSSILFSFNKSYMEDEKVLSKIEEKIQHAFVIKANQKEQLLPSQLAQLKGQYTDAINEHNLIAVDELADIYIGLVDDYFENMKKYGGGFSFTQAHKEISSSWAGGWKQLSDLAFDFRVLLIESLKIGNVEIIRKTAHVPIKISRLAIENDDHYLFQKFNHFPQWFYDLSQKDYISQDVERDLITRSWEFYRNIFLFFIKSKLTDPNLDDEKKQSLKDFSVSILSSYQNLMKDAFDQKDSTAVQKYQEVTLELFDFSHSLDDLLIIELRLKMKGLSPEQREQYQEQLKQLLLVKELSDRKLQMFFGLTSWLFDEYKHQPNDQAMKVIYDSLQSIFNMKITEFTQIFLDSHSSDADYLWNWSYWDRIADGKMHTIQILEKLEQFYAVKSLSILARMTEQAIERIELPYNRDLVNLAGGSRNLVKILDDIAEHPDDWAFVLSEEEVNKVETLKGLLQDVKEKQEAKDLEELRRKPISPEKVVKFKDDFIRGFYGNEGLRKIIKEVSNIENKLSTKPEQNIDRISNNFVIDKYPFLEDAPDGEGSHFGSSLANDENKVMVHQITEKCESLALREFENCFARFPEPATVIILLINRFPYFLLERSNNMQFANLENGQVKYFYQYQDTEIPVFYLFDSSNERKIIVLDKRKIEKLIQYSPLDVGEDEKFMEDIFYMNIQSFSENEELLQEHLDNPPEWLSEKGDQESQKLYLQENVLINIQERFELVLDDEYQGYQIIIEGEE